jgi:hypothetical protein
VTPPDARIAAGAGIPCGAMEMDLYLELTPGGVLRWRRCASWGTILVDDAARARGFDGPCTVWAHTHPHEARRIRATRIARDRETLPAAGPFG